MQDDFRSTKVAMMKLNGIAMLLCAASAVALARPALSQDQAQDSASAGNERQTQNSQCIQALQLLAERMQEDGYWLSGYRGYGTSTVPSPSAARGVAPTTPRPVEPTGELAVEPEADDTSQDAANGSPWRGVEWEQRPQYEIGVLYEAAYVLASSGDEETCRTLVEATQDRYERYTADLEELGIDPAEVTTWRQAEIAASEPVDELDGRFRIEDIVGTDIRNAEDETLGSIDDVMLDPQTGEIQYVVVNRGGVFGIGAEQIIVPWERLRVTSGMSVFVLPVQAAALEQAPSLPERGVFNTGQTASVDTDEVDSYWEQVPRGQ